MPRYRQFGCVALDMGRQLIELGVHKDRRENEGRKCGETRRNFFRVLQVIGGWYPFSLTAILPAYASMGEDAPSRVKCATRRGDDKDRD